MAKVIILSRQFPAYHPKAGMPTFFVEKFWNSLFGDNWSKSECELTMSATLMDDTKHHIIQAGHRFKAGDYFSPRVWIKIKSGWAAKPHKLKQIVIAPDTEVKKVWDFRIFDWGDRFPYIEIKNLKEHESQFAQMSNDFFGLLAENDGLNQQDLIYWLQYPKLFDGQIICWNENINY